MRTERAVRHGQPGRRVTRLAEIVRGWLGERSEATRVVGVHGGQGVGKSTLCNELKRQLEGEGWRVAVVSIDDGYLSAPERQALARAVHPLLATRGVPGTHDVDALRRTLDDLRGARSGGHLPIRRFDKSTGRHRVTAEWVEGPFDLVLFEGWCVGLPPVPAVQLVEPFNRLEQTADPQGTWRRYVAAQIAGPYAALWKELDDLLALLAPDVDAVVAWRTEAEAARIAEGAPGAIRDVEAFVAHYARWTAWGIAELPTVADLVVWLDADRTVTRTRS